MAEDVNFPLDQTQNTSAFKGLRDSAQETGRQRSIEDEQEETRNPERPEKQSPQQPVNEVASLEARVETRQRAGADPQNPTENQVQDSEEDIARAEQRQLQVKRQESTNDSLSEIRNRRSQGSAGANELARLSEGKVQDPQEGFNAMLRRGNELTDTERLDEFRRSSQDNNTQEVVEKAVEEAVSVELEDPSRPLEGGARIRDILEEGRPPQGREFLDETIRDAPPGARERAETELRETGSPDDVRVFEHIQEKRTEEAESRVRNEPALETPSQKIEPIETQEEPIQEGLDTNPLRAPGPSEIRDDDASAVETQRGQNISNII